MDLARLSEKLGQCVSNNEKIHQIKEFLKPELSYILYDAQKLSDIVDRLVGSLSISPQHHVKGALEEKNSKACTLACLVCHVLNGITKELETCDQDYRTEVFSRCFFHYIKLCAQTQQEVNYWCDRHTESCGNQTISSFINIGGYRSVGDALEDRSNEIFKSRLKKQVSLLNREQWKESTAAKSLFIYLLLRANGDILTENLDMFIPFTLLMVDDFVPKNTIMGLKCMKHILHEVPPAEIRFRGRAEVIHDALVKKLYTRDSDVSKVLISCIMQSLDCLESEMMRKRGCSIPRHDECFEIVLNNFHLSSDNLVKRVYSSALPFFVSRMGIQSIGHIKKIIIVLDYGIESTDIQTMLSCIDVISKMVDAAWPRLEHHCEAMLRFLIRALYNLENDDWRWKGCNENGKKKIVNAIIDTTMKLSMLSKELILETAQMLEAETDLALSQYGKKIQQLIATSA
ncbi:TELO2-interacting protein 2-like [Styela clava]